MKIKKDGVVSTIPAPIALPKMFHAKHIYPRETIPPEKIPEVIEAQITHPLFSEKIIPGMSIAITAGSRSIANVDIITKAVVDAVKRRGANSFIVPAMGSHGGSTAQRQPDVLAGKYPGLEALSQPEDLEFDAECTLLTPIWEG